MVEPRSRRWAWAAAALAASIVFLLPLVFLVSGSLRTPGRPPPRAPQFLPDAFAWSNYERAADLVGLGSAALNSAIVAALFVPLSVLVASWAGLALVFVGARVRTVVLALSVAGLMVPLTALLVPRFAVFQWLGLVDSFAPLLAPALRGAAPV
jgi:multiple sugar transport system permease protein